MVHEPSLILLTWVLSILGIVCIWGNLLMKRLGNMLGLVCEGFYGTGLA